MTWRIGEIGIYRSGKGTLSTLKLRPHGLNIISGKSARGKSSILDIVDYCLMSRNCGIAKGVIRDSVSHVGMLLVGPTEHFVIVRALPKQGSLTSTEAFTLRGPNVTLPQITPEMRTNTKIAKDEISDFTGIEDVPVMTNDESSDPEDQYPANIRHCACYLFQPQDIIASRHTTFPIGDDFFERRHVVDALDYFLKVLGIDALRKRRELRLLVNTRNRLLKARRESDTLQSDGYRRGIALWNEAQARRLAPSYTPRTFAELLEGLRSLNGLPSADVAGNTATARIQESEEIEAKLRASLRSHQASISQIDRLLALSSNASSLHDSQHQRLSLRDLIHPDGASTSECPLCGNEVQSEDIFEELKSAIYHSHSSQPPQRLLTKLEKERQSHQIEITKIRTQLNAAQSRLRILLEDASASASYTEEVRKRDRLIGRIAEYASAFDQQAQPQDDLQILEERIRSLLAEVSDQALDRLRSDVETALSNLISLAIPAVDVEFPGHRVRLNFNSLAIEIEFDGKWLRLAELGSGANWLGYHLAVVLALHALFIKRQAPVPQVLFLDQPSQVWFPADAASRGNTTQPTDDAEIAAVRKVYALLDAVGSAEKGPQIIVVDHAKLADTFFQDAIVADWHGSGGLVPESWMVRDP